MAASVSRTMTDTQEAVEAFARFRRAAWPPRSLVSFQLPLSPIAVFAIRIELAHDVAIERLHHADARHHGGSISLGDQD